MDGVERSVLDAVETHGSLSVTTLAKLLNDHPVTIHRYCSELQQDGYLRLQSGGVYVLTEQGKNHLATLTE